jgi:hypothetical protein
MSTFVLVHSPLVGPVAWSRVADELGARGVSVALPTLPENRGAPYWRHDAEAVAAQVADVGEPLVLMGHSGAYPLLPAIRAAMDGTVSAYVLVDGDLPVAPGTGGSRVELLRGRQRWPTSSKACSPRAGASPPGATRTCWRRSPTNECARELWRRAGRSRARSGRNLCLRFLPGRTRRVAV